MCLRLEEGDFPPPTPRFTLDGSWFIPEGLSSSVCMSSWAHGGQRLIKDSFLEYDGCQTLALIIRFPVNLFTFALGESFWGSIMVLVFLLRALEPGCSSIVSIQQEYGH